MLFLSSPSNGKSTLIANTTISPIYSPIEEEFGLIKYQENTLSNKEQAINYAIQLDAKNACIYLKKHIEQTADIDFIKQNEFNSIRNTKAFQKISATYLPKINGWTFFFLFSGIIGVFMSFILNLKKGADKQSNLLLSLFLFIHSLLILHIDLHISNLAYHFPHSYYATFSFSFLYGPLLYFYFKKASEAYKFKITDLLHLVPSVALLIFIVPLYSLSANEKLLLIINQHNYPLPGRDLIIILKSISLVIYNYLIYKSYKKYRKKEAIQNSSPFRKWQKKILILNSIYIISYILYVLPVLKVIPFIRNLDLTYATHFQVAIMAVTVLYVSIIAYTQPSIFKTKIKTVVVNTPVIESVPKYEKSGLTPNLSLELKENLTHLLNTKKVFKQNNLTLDILSQNLETTRHNASQVINEHFDMNFFELINKYRIKEAMSILEKDTFRNMNIIDIAYEVGYNNKVTFYKAFRKETQLTPTEYQEFSKNIAWNAVNSGNSEGNLFPGTGSV